MRSGARALAALSIVAAAASYGVAAAETASAATAPSGGCWSYVPGAAALDSAPASDVSTALEDWTTVPDGGFALTSDGDTAVGGTREMTATIASGPVVSATDDVAGTASFLLSVDDVPVSEPATVDFSADAGDPVEDVSASVRVPIGTAGAHTVRVAAVYFDVPAASPAGPLRVACNGQESETASPAGPNPATDPEQTDIASAFTAVAGSSVTVTSIEDQAVLDTARPGDVVSASLAGLPSSETATVQLCAGSGASTGACVVVGSVVTGADGAATTSFMVPSAAAVGPGTLKVSAGTTEVTTGFSVLGVQLVAAAEELEAESTLVTLTGTGWDPKRDVTIRGYTGTNSSTAATSDATVVAAVDATGAFTAEFEVADEDTQSVIVDQGRSSSHIGAVYLISGVIGGAVVDPDPTDPDPTDDPEPSDDPSTDPTDGATGTPTTAPVTPPVVVDPPVDIPLPGDIPIAEPPVATPGDESGVADLSVTEARLDGETTLSELFGGSPKRELVFLVTNVGDDTVTNPIVRVTVGRTADVEPELVDAEVGDLDPGEQTVVTVPLELPMAAFGDYHVVGQVGDTESGAFQVEWTTYPWGLFALNLLALALLGWGVRRRVLLRRKTSAAASALVGDADAVVDLAAADAWWAYRSGTGARPVRRVVTPVPAGTAGPAAPLAPHPDEPGAGEAIVDLDAAEKWWGRRAGKGGTRAS